MKKLDSCSSPQEVPPPGLTPDEILALVDLVWMALGCPCGIPS